MRFTWLLSCLSLRKMSRGERRHLKRVRTYSAARYAVPRLEQLEDRTLLSAADLIGYDARPLGYPNYYFHVQESSLSWGDQIQLSFNLANLGGDDSDGQSFNVAFYLSPNGTINTSDTLLLKYTGFTVPKAGQLTPYTNVPFTLPASNPFGTTGPYTIGMIVNSDKTVVESNYNNDSNQGNGIDLESISIAPPVAVVADPSGATSNQKVNFGSVADDGAGNAEEVQVVTLSDSAARSLLKVQQNGISLANGTNFHIVNILSNQLSQAVNLTGGYSLIKANNAETWTIEVAFDPVGTGSLTDTLEIHTDDPVNPTIDVPLSGTGVAEPNLVVNNPANGTLNFGNVAVNSKGTAAVTLTNNGSGPLTIAQNGISLPAGAFSIVGITSSTQGAINLAAGSATIAANSAETWTVNLQYSPTVTGLVQLPLTILSDASQDGTDVVSLLGTGETPATLSLDDSNGAVATFTEYPIPTSNSQPIGVTMTPDGSKWFTESNTNKIGKISSAGQLTEFSLSAPPSGDTGTTRGPSNIIVGPGNNLFFTEDAGSYNSIGELTQSGTETEYQIPTLNSLPTGIALGPDGNIWFTENQGNKIGRLNPTTGAIDEFTVPTANSGPNQIVAGPDGNLWFTESTGNLGEITTAGVITEFPVSTALAGITVGADNKLWIAAGAKIVSFDPVTHAITTYTLPADAKGNPKYLTLGPDGNVWYVENQSNVLGRITPAGVVTEFADPNANALLEYLTAGQNGSVWFADNTGTIGQIIPGNDNVVQFGSLPATGLQSATQTITIANMGQLPFNVSQNGITLANGTQFKITGITSSTQGAINLANGPQTIAANGAETWSITVQFAPTAGGSLTDQLMIASATPSSSTTSIALNGTGLNQPILTLNGGAISTNNPSEAFSPTLDDGYGGHYTTQSLQLTNIGTQPLVIGKNGIGVLGGTSFHVVSITSSVSGAVNLAAGSASIAPKGAETWTIVLRFDPTTTGSLTDTLRISSNDPVNPTLNVALSGQGVVPVVNAVYPAKAIDVSAGQAYDITWNGSYSPGTGTYSLYYDTGRNPNTGLVAIATGLPQSQTSYDWQVPTSLVGGTYTIYVKLQDGTVSSGSFAAGSLKVDPANTDRLLSAPVTSNAAYVLSYSYKGTDYTAAYTLTPGENVLYPTGGGVVHEYHVFLAQSLVPSNNTTYDSLGNVTSTTDANGQTTTYTYDQLSRVTQINYPDGSSVEYTYDADSNLLTMHDSTGWEIYGYDALNRLTSVTYSPTDNVNDPAALTIGYKYDADNNLTELDYPSGEKVLYGYDNAGNLTSVTDENPGQPNQVTTYAYDPTTGLLTTETLPNNTEAIYSYDTNGNVVGILYQNTTTQALILQYQYTLDAAGRQTLAVTTSPTGSTAQAYVYDDMDRLIQVTYSNSSTISSTDEVVQYTYDGNGNRLTQTTYANGIAAGATQTLTNAYNTQNELLSITDQNGVVQDAYAYDWRGNEIEDVTPTKTTLYTYNSQNQLIEVNDGTNVTQYSYDGAGRRMLQTVNGVTTRFVVDPSNADYQTLEEMTNNGVMTASYTYGLGRISGALPGQSTATYYMSDALGSVGGLTSNTGAGLGYYSYNAFGSILMSSASANNPFTFTGEQFDPTTGLIDLRARQYNPSTGRFLSQDPLAGQNGTNDYLYAQSEPTVDADPLGLAPTTLHLSFSTSLFVGKGGGATAGIAVNLDDPNVQKALDAYAIGDDYIPVIDDLAATISTLPYFRPYYTTESGSGIGVTPPTETVGFYNGTPEQMVSQTTNLNIGPVTDIFSDGQLAGVNLSNPFTDELGGVSLTESSGQVGGTLGSYYNTAVNDINSAAEAIGNGLDAFGAGMMGLDITPSSPSPSSSIEPGGVLIDQAATLLGENINDIAGATYDPTTNQLVFLGTDNTSSTLSNVNLDLFTTAIQAVYGSSGPPYVTLDPSAKLVAQNFDIGSGNGVIPGGQSVAIPIDYTPYTPTNADDMTLSFDVNSTPVSARINAEVLNGTNNTGTVIAGGRYVTLLTLGNVTGLPSGVTMSQPTFPVTIGPGSTIEGGTVTIDGGSGYTLTANAQGQQSTFYFTINNANGSAATITNLQLVTDLQQRKFGGPINNTELGWIMEEADRVMKELAGGKDQLSGATYTSALTLPSQYGGNLPSGFENVLERYVANNQSGTFGDRFWFTPAEETLERYVDPTTGEATVVFSQSAVQLNTEALLLGQPQDPTALAFANWFNANYTALENLDFPVHDPSDPTGTNVIYVPIFQLLNQAMQAVALARFFHDNNIPLNTWWINSYTPPVEYTLNTIPTLTNSLQNGSVTVNFYGGVTIKTPNTYVPDVVAQDIANDVLSQRTAPPTGDVADQAWSVTGTPMGSLNAVAASLDDVQQQGAITLAATDLSFASLGGQQLSFQRYYNSSYLGGSGLGLGWQPNEFQLQFQYPTMEDYAGLMRDSNGNPVPIYGADSDTYLRSGEIRLMDQATGQFLNFYSSLTTSYALDGQGNPILATTGLNANDVPTFTPGQYTDGSTLTQDPSSHDYILTRPDGSKMVFDPQGDLLSTTDNKGYAITYTYSNGLLSQISDSAGQVLSITYGSNGLIEYVAGPDNSATPQRRIAYVYDSNNRLTEVDTQALQGNGTYTTASSVQYQYNSSNQLSAVIGSDGLTTLTDAPNLRGQSTQNQDVLGNMVDNSYTQNAVTGATTTESTDMGNASGVGTDPSAQGVAALQYVASGATSTSQLNSSALVTQTTNALGDTTQYGYTTGSVLPNSVTLPSPNRPAISINYNSANLPTVIDDPANTGGAPVQITYNAADLPETTTDAKGLVTMYTYTTWNDIATVTVGYGTPLAATTTYNYNAQKLLQSIVDPLGHTVASYTYDQNGNVTSETDGDGVTTTYTYDTLNRLQRVYEPNLTGDTNYIQYTYNDNDQVTQIATPTGNITYQYDPTTHWLTSETDLTGATTNYGYDPTTGLLTSVTQVSSGGNAVTQAVYDREGNLAEIIAPNGDSTAFEHDALGQTTAMYEDPGVNPTAQVSVQQGSPSGVQVNVTASQTIVAASLEYWLASQPESSSTTQSVRPGDQTSFAFDLSDPDLTHVYDYKLTLTDSVGRTNVVSGTFGHATYVVTSAADSGAGTLRDAINQVNAGNYNEIDFQIGTAGTAQTIKLASPLPTLTASHVYINGLSQEISGRTKQLITLSGTNAGANSDGLLLEGSNCTVSGLLVEGFNGNGIEVEGDNDIIGGTAAGAGNIVSGNAGDGILLDSSATGALVQGNWIGVTTTGTGAMANGGNGIEDAGTSNTIGGTTTAARNVISGNSKDGVLIDSSGSGTMVEGNYIGTNANGTGALANKGNGIEDGGSSDTIGGTTTAARNVISGNSKDGVLIDSSGSGILVQGNYIGVGAGGGGAVANSNGIEVAGSNNTIGGTASGALNVISGNSKDGILIDSSGTGTLVRGNYIGVGVGGGGAVANSNGIEVAGSNNTIGGTVSGALNLISGNKNYGVLIDAGVTGVLLQGNYIGTNLSGNPTLGNGIGVEVNGNNNAIGGSASGAGNTIAYNKSGGVLVSAGSGNSIRGNSIYSNGPSSTGPGISISSGGNNNLAAPLISSVALSGGTLTVNGTFTAPTANVPYILEFFANPNGDPEGKIFLGSLTVTPTSGGTQSFTFTTANTSLLASNPMITATLTDSLGDTSTFSSGVAS